MVNLLKIFDLTNFYLSKSGRRFTEISVEIKILNL